MGALRPEARAGARCDPTDDFGPDELVPRPTVATGESQYMQHMDMDVDMDIDLTRMPQVLPCVGTIRSYGILCTIAQIGLHAWCSIICHAR